MDEREELILAIRQFFIKHGRSLIDTKNPYHAELTKLSIEELRNALDNLMINRKRLKKTSIIERTIAAMSESIKLFSEVLNVQIPPDVFNALETDQLLRESAVASAFGKGFSPPSWWLLSVTLVFYFVRFGREYVAALNSFQNHGNATAEGNGN